VLSTKSRLSALVGRVLKDRACTFFESIGTVPLSAVHCTYLSIVTRCRGHKWHEKSSPSDVRSSQSASNIRPPLPPPAGTEAIFREVCGG